MPELEPKSTSPPELSPAQLIEIAHSQLGSKLHDHRLTRVELPIDDYYALDLSNREFLMLSDLHLQAWKTGKAVVALVMDIGHRV